MTHEFVVNLVSFELREAMNIASMEFPPQTDELKAANVETIPVCPIDRNLHLDQASRGSRRALDRREGMQNFVKSEIASWAQILRGAGLAGIQ